MANIPIRDIPGAVVASPDPSNLIPMDNGALMQKTTIANAVSTVLPLASQATAEAGVNNSDRMSSLRTKQAIDAQTPLIVNTAITALNLGTMSQEESSDYTPTSGLAAVALSNDYDDLDNLPTLGTAAATDASDYATAAQGSLADTAVQPGDAELVPAGGTIGQVLVKNSGTNYDTGWVSSAAATAVSYAPQTLTESQQEQARENVDALGPDETPDRAFRRGNILGAVSQSAGVPTGAIIETGTNANGGYTKWADGTMICTHDVNTINSNTAAGNIFRSSVTATWTFPATFASAPICAAQIDDSTAMWVNIGAQTTTQAYIRAFSTSAISAGFRTKAIAIGRWF